MVPYKLSVLRFLRNLLMDSHVLLLEILGWVKHLMPHFESHFHFFLRIQRLIVDL